MADEEEVVLKNTQLHAVISEHCERTTSFLQINTELVRRGACLAVFTLSAVGKFGRPGDARVHSKDIRRVHGVPQIQTGEEKRATPFNEDNQMLDASEKVEFNLVPLTLWSFW